MARSVWGKDICLQSSGPLEKQKGNEIIIIKTIGLESEGNFIGACLVSRVSKGNPLASSVLAFSVCPIPSLSHQGLSEYRVPMTDQALWQH